MVSRFVITDHALIRFGERNPAPPLVCTSPPVPLSLRERGDEGLRQALLAELERGVAYGGQVGSDELYLLPCGDVAAVVWDRGIGIVKTVLTREHAIANMQSRGAILRSTREYRREPDVDELRELAVRHFNAGISRKARNALLREVGYDPAGEAGDIYRDAYGSACRAALEAHREAYLRRKASAA